ncbi:MAG: PLP-dependent aspartate aminotransferase family protein [Gemmatimonadota bacterium]|nr:PLP-dependent aspartate aminotransferase family protein [Gemmatimonadota bacterium]MDH5803791.1 PLP-dependent aspartate aminotransferase family protein [Gemmatimonadota bacterium]
MKKIGPGFSTRAIHGYGDRLDPAEPVATPIYQSATFANTIGGKNEVLYTRYGNNPNQLKIGEKLAALEGAEAAIFVGSGMGATALAHLAMLNRGDHLLASKTIYGGTLSLFTKELPRYGIDVTLVDPDKTREWRSKLRKNTRVVFVETPTNPLARVIDLEPLAGLCRSRNIALIVDSTFATPLNFRPLQHGADIVIHSATKYLSGHSDVIAGAVAASTDVIEEVRAKLKNWGQALDPHAAWLVERGMKTLAVRMERHNENAMALAQWAEQHPKINSVSYPGLPSHPDHELATRILDGFGGMMAIRVKGGRKAAEAALRRLRIAIHAPSLGGVETLVSEPRVTSHAAMSTKERTQAGLPDGTIRISVGIEDIQDLIHDFDQALTGTG